jgi:hypothetical protein
LIGTIAIQAVLLAELLFAVNANSSRINGKLAYSATIVGIHGLKSCSEILCRPKRSVSSLIPK